MASGQYQVYSSGGSGAFALFRRLRMVVGLGFLAFGIAVLLFPQILVIVISSVFIMIGAGILGSLWLPGGIGAATVERDIHVEVRPSAPDPNRSFEP